jgi:thiamine kinase-like enzyme
MTHSRRAFSGQDGSGAGEGTAPDRAARRIARMRFWPGPILVRPLTGGITNVNILVECGGEKYFVRLGEDIPLHHVMRFNELAASRAAYLAGVSPQVLHAEPGVLVLQYLDARPLGEKDVIRQAERILPVLQRAHRDMPRYLRGPALIFWVFHVVRDYAATLKESGSPHIARLSGFLDVAEELERAVGEIDLVYGHNDLLPANLLDDGNRIWLVDWDYAGFNSPLFDLGGMASNSGMSAKQEEWLLEAYFDRVVTDGLRRRYAAMKAASLLRETMWSMVSEIHSTLEFDYPAYTKTNLARFEAALADFRQL